MTSLDRPRRPGSTSQGRGVGARLRSRRAWRRRLVAPVLYSPLMSAESRRHFSIRPHDTDGSWLSDDRRYFESATQLLSELEAVAEQVKQLWPGPLDQT